MLVLKLNETTPALRRVPIHLVDATDGISPELGEAAGQPQLSKNGATAGNTSATLVSVGNGLYYVELTQPELDTPGFGVIRYKSVETAEAQVVFQVAAFDPYDATGFGLSRLDATVSSRSSHTEADVKAQVVSALATDTYAEPTAVPAATASLKDKIGWLAALARNKIIGEGSQQRLRNDADALDTATAQTSDAGGQSIRDKWL